MEDKKVLKSFVMVTQLGISMMVPIFLCGFIGYWLNGQFHGELYFPIFLVIGIGAGFRNVYILTRGFYAKEQKKEQESAAYLAELKDYSRTHPEEDFSDVMERKKKRYPDTTGPTRS